MSKIQLDSSNRVVRYSLGLSGAKPFTLQFSDTITLEYYAITHYSFAFNKPNTCAQETFLSTRAAKDLWNNTIYNINKLI